MGAFATIYLLSFLIGIPARRIAWPNLIDRGISNLSKLIGGIYVSSVDFALILSLVNLYLSALAVFAGAIINYLVLRHFTEQRSLLTVIVIYVVLVAITTAITTLVILAGV